MRGILICIMGQVHVPRGFLFEMRVFQNANLCTVLSFPFFIFLSILSLWICFLRVSGYIYDQLGSYLIPFLCAGIPPIVGSLVLFSISCMKQPPQVWQFCILLFCTWDAFSMTNSLNVDLFVITSRITIQSRIWLHFMVMMSLSSLSLLPIFKHITIYSSILKAIFIGYP